jgi:hypothetical protein
LAINVEFVAIPGIYMHTFTIFKIDDRWGDCDKHV